MDLRPFLSQLTIQTKDLTLEKLDLSSNSEFAWAQSLFVDEVERQYNSGKPVRIIVLKARQIGISTITEAILFLWLFIHQGANALLLANKQETAEEIFGKTKLYWETWPHRLYYSLRYASKRHMQWIETRSALRASPSKNLDVGRGMTFHAVHATECAFYPDARTLMTGLHQTLPFRHGTIEVLESTANGSGDWWHEQWLKAENRESAYVPLFFPWYKHSEYQQYTTICTDLELTPSERAIKKRFGLTYEQIQWRRWAVINLTESDEQKFMQEYPATPEEAFIATGQPIFPHDRLSECYKQVQGVTGFFTDNSDGSVRFINDPAGNVTLYAKPHPTDRRWDRYFVAGDPSETVVGDPACIQVINRKTFQQVAVWHGRIDPITFADEMIRLGKFYNYAMLCPEVMGGGQATVAAILTKNYPNVWQNRWADQAPGRVGHIFGWSTNHRYKSWAISTLKKLILDRSITIHDKRTYNQLRDYVVRPNGEWGNANEQIHDDAVMALAIAVTASMSEGPFVETVLDPRNPGDRPKPIQVFNDPIQDWGVGA